LKVFASPIFRFFIMSSCTLGVAVAVNAIIGILSPKRLIIVLKLRYSGLKSCPHSEIQWASSMATKEIVCDFKKSTYSFLFRSEEHTSELQSRENLVCRL